MRDTVKLPTLRDATRAVLTNWQLAAQVHIPAPQEEDGSEHDDFMDIRLVISGYGWDMFTGDVSYDQWHGVACGASALDLTSRPTRAASERIARELLAQC